MVCIPIRMAPNYFTSYEENELPHMRYGPWRIDKPQQQFATEARSEGALRNRKGVQTVLTVWRGTYASLTAPKIVSQERDRCPIPSTTSQRFFTIPLLPTLVNQLPIVIYPRSLCQIQKLPMIIIMMVMKI